PRGDLHLELPLLDRGACAVADRAGLLDPPAAAGAARAGLGAHELAEHAPRDLADAPRPAAGWAGRDLAAGLCSGGVAVRARDGHGERDLSRDARTRRYDLDLHRGCDVRPADVAPRRPSEEVVAEEGGEDVRERAEVEVAGCEPAAAQAGVAVAVVELAALAVREHLVRLGDLAEPLLGVG